MILDEKIQASVQVGDPEVIDKMRAAMEMEININGIAKGLAKFLMTHQSQYLERVRDDEGDFDRAFRRYKNLSLRSGEKQSAAELSAGALNLPATPTASVSTRVGALFRVRTPTVRMPMRSVNGSGSTVPRSWQARSHRPCRLPPLIATAAALTIP